MSKISKEDWLKRFASVHEDRYDYSLVEIVDSHTPVKIACKIHGIFNQRPDCHYLRKHGCPTCASEENAQKKAKGVDKFVEEANLVHNNFYDYSLVDYKQNKIKVKIICPVHGEFSQIPLDHIKGRGCGKCGYEKVKRWKDEDDEFLKENYLFYGPKHCAEKLKKTVSAVISRAQMLRCVRNFREEKYNENIPTGIMAGIYKRMEEWDTPLDFDSHYIFNLLGEQDYKCALTGKEIKFTKKSLKENTASVDRIDSKLPYSKDNIQIVHKKFNRFKNNLDERELLEMCQMVVKNLGARFAAIEWTWDIMNDTEVPIKVLSEKPVLEKDRHRKYDEDDLF